MAKTQSDLYRDIQRAAEMTALLIAILMSGNSFGQTDALASAAANRQIEGDDAANGTSTPTVRLGNYVQTSTKYAIVTDVQNAVKKAGRNDEMSYQIAKRLGEIKRKQHCALTV